jgi:hypothetical protein
MQSQPILMEISFLKEAHVLLFITPLKVALWVIPTEISSHNFQPLDEVLVIFVKSELDLLFEYIWYQVAIMSSDESVMIVSVLQKWDQKFHKY